MLCLVWTVEAESKLKDEERYNEHPTPCLGKGDPGCECHPKDITMASDPGEIQRRQSSFTFRVSHPSLVASQRSVIKSQH